LSLFVHERPYHLGSLTAGLKSTISKDNVFLCSISIMSTLTHVVFVCRVSLMVICQFHIVASSLSDTTPVTHQFSAPKSHCGICFIIWLKHINGGKILVSVSCPAVNTVREAVDPATSRLIQYIMGNWHSDQSFQGAFTGFHVIAPALPLSSASIRAISSADNSKLYTSAFDVILSGRSDFGKGTKLTAAHGIMHRGRETKLVSAADSGDG